MGSNGHHLPSPLQIPVSRAFLRASSSMLFLLSFTFESLIFPSRLSIFTVVINKHSFSVRVFFKLFFLSIYIQIPTGFYPSHPAVSTVAINDNNHQHAFIACSIFANNLPLWHWWQHLHSTFRLQLSSAFNHSDSPLLPKHFELDSFLPLWHQCQRRNIISLILL